MSESHDDSQGDVQPAADNDGQQAAPQQGGAGRQPGGGYQRGPSVGDIFSMDDTKSEMQLGVVLFGAVGIGVAVAGILAPLIQGAGGVLVAGILLLGSLALGPGIGALLGLRQEEELEEVADNLVYANAAVTAAVGTIVLGLIGGIGVTIGSSFATLGPGGGAGGGSVAGLADVLIPLIVVAIGAAVTGALVVWAIRGPLSASPPPAPRGAAGQQQSPPSE